MFACDAWSSAVGPPASDPRWKAELDQGRPLRLRSCRRLVVVTAHLDEDVCAVGGLLAWAGEHAIRVDVLAVTDGDGTTATGAARHRLPVELHSPAQHRVHGPAVAPAAAGGEDEPRDVMREMAERRAHRRLGYQRLGCVAIRQSRLRLDSGAVAASEPDVAAALSEIVGFADTAIGLWVLAPWGGDGHADHAAVARAADQVCPAYGVRLVNYPTAAAWTRAEPHTLPWQRMRTLALSPRLQARKNNAICPAVRRGRDDPIADREILFA